MNHGQNARRNFVAAERDLFKRCIDDVEREARREQEKLIGDQELRDLLERRELALDAPERLRQVDNLCEYLKELISELREDTEDREIRRLSFAASCAVQTMVWIAGELADEATATQTLPSCSSQAAATLNALWKWVTQVLKPLIIKVSHHLWNIISALLTPQSWTIQGGIQIPGLASAQISVTFGS